MSPFLYLTYNFWKNRKNKQINWRKYPGDNLISPSTSRSMSLQLMWDSSHTPLIWINPLFFSDIQFLFFICFFFNYFILILLLSDTLRNLTVWRLLSFNTNNCIQKPLKKNYYTLCNWKTSILKLISMIFLFVFFFRIIGNLSSRSLKSVQLWVFFFFLCYSKKHELVQYSGEAK